MPGAVVRHDFAHVVVELLPVFGFGHVYEVDHDYSAHIAKSQLASYFVGGAQVHFQGVGFLVIARFCAVAGVYVDHMERFGVLYDDVCTVLERHCFPERRLYLACNAEMVEDGFALCVEFHNVGTLGGNQTYIVLNLCVGVGIVDVYAFEGGAEYVAEHAHDAAFFFKDKGRRLHALCFGTAFVEGLEQCLEFGIEVFGLFPFGRGAHYDAEVARLHAFHKPAQAHFLFGAFDFLRNGYFVAEGCQHHIAAGEAQLCCQSRALRRYWLFHNLHQQFAALFDGIGDGAVLVDFGFELYLFQLRALAAVGKEFLEVFGV